MVQGFLCEEGDVAGITTSISAAAVITLSATTAAKQRDNNAVQAPAGGYLSHIDLQLLATGGGPPPTAPGNLTVLLTYDVTGNDPAAVITAVPTIAAATTADTYVARAYINEWYRWPAGVGSGGTIANTYPSTKFYLFLVTTAGTVTLKKARLQWRDHHAGG